MTLANRANVCSRTFLSDKEPKLQPACPTDEYRRGVSGTGAAGDRRSVQGRGGASRLWLWYMDLWQATTSRLLGGAEPTIVETASDDH